MAKVLVTGASGRIGRAIVKSLEDIFLPEDKIYLFEHQKPIPLPQEPRDKFKELTQTCDPWTDASDTLETHYDFCLHLAAITDTKFCNERKNFKKVIDANVGLTAQVCKYSDRVVLISTDNVYSGNSALDYPEIIPPNPLNFYGLSKKFAEELVLHSRGTVVRIQTMLGCENRIVSGAIGAIRGETHKPFWNNTFSRPSWIHDLILTLRATYRRNYAGEIFHCACAGKVFSRAEIAKCTLDFFKEKQLPHAIDAVPEEVCAVDFPRRLVLESSWTQQKLGLSFTDSETALQKHLLGTLYPA